MIKRLIQLILDRAAAAKLEKEVDRSMRKVARESESTMSQAFKRIGGFIAAAFSIRAIVNFTREMFRLGASAAETGSKFRTVFGSDRARELDAFLGQWARLAGLTREAGQNMLANFGAVFQGAGLAADASADLSEQMVRLAGDLQSFHDVPIAEVFQALRSGTTGETEPLKRFGIVLRATEVDARALAMTGKETAASLTEQERVVARVALIYEKAGVAVGDLAKTQDSEANTARRIMATYEQLRQNFANGLLPVFGMIVRAWGDIADGAQGAVDVMGGFFTRLGDLVEGVQRLAVHLNVFFRSIPAEFKRFAAMMLTDIVTQFLEPAEGIVNRLRSAFGKEAVDFTSGLSTFSAQLRDDAAIDLAAWRALIEEETQAIIDARTVIDEHRDAPGTGGSEPGLVIPDVARRDVPVQVGTDTMRVGDGVREELDRITSDVESVNPFAGLIEQVDFTAAYMRDGFEGVGRAIVAQLIDGRAEEQFASGLAALASGTWPPNPAAFVAAGKHFAAAAAFKALGATVAGAFGGGGGGGGGGVGSIPRGAVGTSVPGTQQPAPAEVHIYMNPLSPSDAKAQAFVAGAMQNAQERYGPNVTLHVHPGANS